VPIRCTWGEVDPPDRARPAPLSSGLWHCTAYPGNPGSHLGSTLNPGRAVLTLGVFRRSRSVAYIRTDASPSEVLAEAIVPPRLTGVNSAGENDCRGCGRAGAVGLSPSNRKLLWLLVDRVKPEPGINRISCGPGSREGGRVSRVRRQLRRFTPTNGLKITRSSLLLSGGRWMRHHGGTEPIAGRSEAEAASAHTRHRHSGHTRRPGHPGRLRPRAGRDGPAAR